MSYADSLGVLKTISQDKYIDAIRDGIDDLGAKVEAAGYKPTDIRRYFRMVLAKLAGPGLADYCWDFFVWSRANMLFRYAEANYDRTYPTSLGLLWKITCDPDEGMTDAAGMLITWSMAWPQRSISKRHARRKRNFAKSSSKSMAV